VMLPFTALIALFSGSWVMIAIAMTTASTPAIVQNLRVRLAPRKVCLSCDRWNLSIRGLSSSTTITSFTYRTSFCLVRQEQKYCEKCLDVKPCFLTPLKVFHRFATAHSRAGHTGLRRKRLTYRRYRKRSRAGSDHPISH
jgi:hypothetical protein